jgi:RNA-directed DNA polymerase
MMKPSTPPDDHRAATEVPRNSGHPLSYATFAYLGHYLWFRVWHWLRRKHPKVTWKDIRRRYFRGGSWPASHNRVLLNPTTVGTSRYRYRGAAIPAPWPGAA